MIDRATSEKAKLLQKAANLRTLQERQRGSCECSPSSQPPSVQLSLFKASSKQRGAFNEILRCAVFGAGNRNQPRRELKNEVLPIYAGGTIALSCEELRQIDGTVWLQIVHLAKELPPGAAVEFRPYSFCKAIGWQKINGGCYKRLGDCLLRLRKALLVIDSERLEKCITINLLADLEWTYNPIDKAPTGYSVKIDPSLTELFEGGHYTRIEWEQRLTLPVGLATWLHDFYSTHRKPLPLKLETLKKHAGITVRHPKHLREMFKNALEALKHVGFLSSYRIDGDLVHVARTARKNLAC